MLTKETIIYRTPKIVHQDLPGSLKISLRTREIQVARDNQKLDQGKADLNSKVAIYEADKAVIEAQGLANKQIQGKIAEDQAKNEADRKANEERALALDDREQLFNEREAKV